MYIAPGIFMIDEFEEVILSGDYDIKEVRNENTAVTNMDPNILGQTVYFKGNVLYRRTSANVDDMIKLFIRYTYDSCEELECEFDFSIKSVQKFRKGYICLTKKVLFFYDNRIYIAFGKYSFGCDKPYAKFIRDGEPLEDETSFCGEDTDSDCSGYEGDGSDFVEWYNDSIAGHLITTNKIILGVPEIENIASESVHAFMIFDENDGILDAFGLYR